MDVLNGHYHQYEDSKEAKLLHSDHLMVQRTSNERILEGEDDIHVEAHCENDFNEVRAPEY